VVGQVAASPRIVHRMAGTVLAALTGKGDAPFAMPTLLDRLAPGGGEIQKSELAEGTIISKALIKAEARELLTAFLSAPLCYKFGTLKRLGDWCAERRGGVVLHFAKTGTRGTGVLDPAAYDTVDLWVAGGIKFDSGRAYSYVIAVGTGSPAHTWARDLYAAQVAEPLLRVLLEDLEDDTAPAPKKVTEAR
jgi:penicillin-binding protein 1A